MRKNKELFDAYYITGARDMMVTQINQVAALIEMTF